MATWSWIGPGTGDSPDWFITSNWSTDSTAPYPQSGDIVTIGSTSTGGPTISPSDPDGGLLDGLQVILGANTLTTAGTDFGPDFVLTAGQADASSYLLLSGGPVQYAGTIIADGPASDMNIGLAAGVSAGDFTLDGGVISVSDRDSFDAGVGQAGSLVNDGTVEVTGGSSVNIDSGALEGTGTVELGTASKAYLVGAVGSGQIIDFTGSNDLVWVNDVGQFAGTISGFQASDVLLLRNVIANGVSYDAADSTLTLTQNGAVQATLTLTVNGTPPTFYVQRGRLGALITTSDSTLTWNGGTGDWFQGSNWTSSSGGSAVPQPGDKIRIHAGTVTVSAAEAANTLFDAETIRLASTNAANPSVLETDDASFGPDADIRGGADFSSGTLEALGTTILQGRMMATARAGTLTLDIESDGTAAVFRNTDDTGLLMAAQRSKLLITGAGTLTNNGVILAEGSVDIGAGIDVNGGEGYIQLQNGGDVSIAGTVHQAIYFGDTTGELTVNDLKDLRDGAAIVNFQQGNSIDLPNVTADEFSYDASGLVHRPERERERRVLARGLSW